MSLTEHTEFTESNRWFYFFHSAKKIKPTFSFFSSVLSVRSSEVAERVRYLRRSFALPRQRRGFTLVELLLVMGVIILLVAMLFPVVIGMKNNARKKQALTEAHTVVLALKGYRMEFGQWPDQSQDDTDKTYFTNNNLVVRPLMGNNARGKVFLTIQASNQTDSVTNLTDPWGVPYIICLDEDMNGDCLMNLTNVVYTNMFAVPSETKSYSASNYVANMEVIVASFADKTNANTGLIDVETWSDPR